LEELGLLFFVVAVVAAVVAAAVAAVVAVVAVVAVAAAGCGQRRGLRFSPKLREKIKNFLGQS